MKIIDFFFYLCSKYMRMGVSDSEPSLLTGAAGVGFSLGAILFVLIYHVPYVALERSTKGPNKIIFFVVLLFSCIISFFYYRHNGRWKKIAEHYEQKQMRYKTLIYLLCFSFMYIIAIGVIPYGLHKFLDLITK